MDFFIGMLFQSIVVLVEYQILTFVLIGIVLYHFIKHNQQVEFKSFKKILFAYLAAVALVIGLPFGIIMFIHHETPNADKEVVQEVRSWIN